MVRPSLHRSGCGSTSRSEEETIDDVSQLADRLRAVDADTERGAPIEALRVPGAQCPELVDHPAVTSPRRFLIASGSWRDVTKTFGFGRFVIEQQLDILQQEPAALLERDVAHRTARGEVRRLR